MKSTLIISIALLSVVGCALFTVSENTKTVGTQRTPSGVVNMFKDALDSNNQHIAKELMRRNDGKPLLAIERYELKEDLQRYRQFVLGKPITGVKQDSISEAVFKVSLELDYIKKMQFYTVKVEDLWYVSKVVE